MSAPGPSYEQYNQPPAQPGGAPNAATGPETTRPEKKHPVSVGQILGGLLFVLVIIFIVENSRSVKIRLIVPEVKAPLYIAILIAAVLGALITWLLRYRRHRHHSTR